MKEEIEMDKLIKLLNEFENTDNWENGYQVEFRESKIISKKFGFIKRLVDNDKIDFDKLKPLTGGITEIMLATNYPNGIKAKRRYRLYEQLIMLLSISDTPINDLISYLE